MVLESVLLGMKRLGYRNDDDSVDRAHYFVTSNILIALAILVSWKQFGGKPIECLTPPKFPGAWEDVSASAHARPKCSRPHLYYCSTPRTIAGHTTH
jgi:hypothetical protein